MKHDFGLLSVTADTTRFRRKPKLSLLQFRRVSVSAETENVVSAAVSVTAVTEKVVSVGLYFKVHVYGRYMQ